MDELISLCISIIISATLNTVHNLIHHCQSRIHLWKIKQLFNIKKKKKEESVASSITAVTEYISKVSISDKKTYVSDEIDNAIVVTRDVDEEIKKYLNVSPLKRKAKTTFKTKPLAEYLNKVYNEEYLKIEEKMYTIHEQKIDDIKLNLKLIMPYNDKNFYCIVCDKRVSKELYLLYEHVSLASHKIHVKNIKREEFKMIEQHIKKISEGLMKCFSCNNNIENVSNNVTTHINNSMHKKRTKMFNAVRNNTLNSILQVLNTLWFSIERYCCVLCEINFRYKIEFLEHILEKHKGILEDRAFDFCIPCATLWLDTGDSYTNHCDDVLHKYLMKSKDFMIDEFPNCMRKLLTQADEISDVLFKESQVLLNDSIQQEMEQSLESSFKSYFPFVKAYSFGSRVTGLAFANSDIDIYLDCGTYYDDERKHLEMNNLIIIKEVLQKRENEWDVRQILKNARIPVIRVIYKRTNIHCDISLTNSLSVENSKLIRSYNDAYLPCRKLILFIKKWFSLFNLPSGHGFKNYALTWLVIFYLQVESYLPSVAALIKTKNKSKVIWGWETGVAKPNKNDKSVQSISTLLLGFFKFYGNFDYQHYIICPLIGQPVAKKSFAMYTLPKEMVPYIKHITTSKNPEYFRIDSPLGVQDPFDLSHNITKSVHSITLKCFKQYCQDSTSVLLSLTK
ncbi:Terminal uridylyltransferase Tailor [Anthophora retusa]